MRVFRNLPAAAASGVEHLALGFFDGLHTGHWSVIQPEGGPLHDVLTFWPHPRAILRPGEPTRLITGLDHKLHLLRDRGIGNVIVHPFDTTTANTGAADFLESLRQHLPALRSLSCGPNFHFGKTRTGDPQLLADWCARHHLGFHTASFHSDPDGVVSSSRIRDALELGDLARAGRLLGRPYSIRGNVVRGDGLGRQLGFPTANLDTNDEWQMPQGVYSAKILIDKESAIRPAVLNVGHRPTLNQPESAIRIEAHLPGFEGDLYGKTMEIIPLRFLRAEMRFSDTSALQDQIRSDITHGMADF